MSGTIERHLAAFIEREGKEVACTVTTSTEPRPKISARFESAVMSSVEVDGHDFEDALVALRRLLEAEGVLLLCNRFRRDAFVSSLSRQMSGGLQCYLVRRGRPVDPGEVVDSLGAADRADVTTSGDAAAFIESWKRSAEGSRIRRWMARWAH